MPNDYVSLKQLSDDLGMGRSHARSYALRHRIQPHKRRTPDSQNQLTLAVTVQEAEAIKTKRREEGFLDAAKPVSKEIRRTEEAVLVKAARAPCYRLSELLAGVTKKNMHAETNWGRSVGRETLK